MFSIFGLEVECGFLCSYICLGLVRIEVCGCSFVSGWRFVVIVRDFWIYGC